MEAPFARGGALRAGLASPSVAGGALPGSAGGGREPAAAVAASAVSGSVPDEVARDYGGLRRARGTWSWGGARWGRAARRDTRRPGGRRSATTPLARADAEDADRRRARVDGRSAWALESTLGRLP